MVLAPSPAAFDFLGTAAPDSPVVLSVPHAGRDYPLRLRAALRVPLGALQVLEDRHVDSLALAAHAGEALLIQRRARAWIDLNRAEAERDPAIDEGAVPVAAALTSAKLRGGLGLVPRRIAGAGELWRRRFDGADIAARIADDHRPYHAALDEALRRARARFGVAVLLDIHSMPSLGPGAARIVIGDRFGRSAAARIVAAIEGVALGHGIASALNTPYAGGHILERHARPEAGIHAVQLEFDRALYLDAALDRPGAGLAATAALLRAVIDASVDEALAAPQAIAAE